MVSDLPGIQSSDSARPLAYSLRSPMIFPFTTGRSSFSVSFVATPASCLPRCCWPPVLKSHSSCDSTIVNGTWRCCSLTSPRCSNSAVTPYRPWTLQSSNRKYFPCRRNEDHSGIFFFSRNGMDSLGQKIATILVPLCNPGAHAGCQCASKRAKEWPPVPKWLPGPTIRQSISFILFQKTRIISNTAT